MRVGDLVPECTTKSVEFARRGTIVLQQRRPETCQATQYVRCQGRKGRVFHTKTYQQSFGVSQARHVKAKLLSVKG